MTDISPEVKKLIEERAKKQLSISRKKASTSRQTHKRKVNGRNRTASVIANEKKYYAYKDKITMIDNSEPSEEKLKNRAADAERKRISADQNKPKPRTKKQKMGELKSKIKMLNQGLKVLPGDKRLLKEKRILKSKLNRLKYGKTKT